MAKGLVELGIAQEDVVDLFAETSANWKLMSYAYALVSTPIATAYDTLGVVRFVFYDGTPAPAEEEILAKIRKNGSKKVLGTGIGDLEELKLDIMLGVPAVWETVRKPVYAKLAKAPKIAQHAFEAAFRVKKFTSAMSLYTSPSASASTGTSSVASALKWEPDQLTSTVQRGVDALLDETILKQVRGAVGGNVKFAVNGGAAVSGETQEFFAAVGVPLVQDEFFFPSFVVLFVWSWV
ncbi:hypothetical protein D9619_012551 [Psilocybe cf. subviscida]|uniref:AMP-dependent synthetase/ligase domain-containing protein n=1 Tax=Psilocybe cf. subviscida TaxID=2480587 RepID=A0A8H5EZF0_9AGAR|nr:hypothetical protein D9619_012551 [Psilocybe cf. subviscida]